MRHPLRSTANLIPHSITAADAVALDTLDPLAAYAGAFHQPYDERGRRLVYLAGHSLGLQPKSAKAYVDEELADWQRFGVLGHHSGRRAWIGYHERVAAPLAALLGAATDEVVAMNSLTVNLHLMMISFFRPVADRRKILIEKSSFPSDRYAVLSQLNLHGLNAREHLIEVAPRPGERNIRTADVLAIIEREASTLALVLLPGVQYLTGQLFELPALVAAARRAGARVGLDLAHAIGNVPLRLHDWDADFAVWCSYKYLNAGPGAIGGAFVHARHGHEPALPRLTGWWGQDKATRFDMGPEFTPIAGAEGWQISNPPILSTAPLLASLDLFMRAGMPSLRDKSVRLTAFLQHCIEQSCGDDVEFVTPGAAAERGCQLSLRILRDAGEAKRCHDRLSAAGVIGDWREPDILRLAPVPLYNSFSDVFTAATALARAVDQ